MKFLVLLLLIVTCFSVTNCSSVHVDTDYDNKTDFAQYTTFQWVASQQEPKMDPMQEEERLVLEKRLRKAVQEDLTTKGYVYSERGDVDLLIYIEVRQTTRINIQQGTAGYTTHSGRDTSGARSSQYYLPSSATVDARHPLTAGHSQRVTEYSLLISEEMGMDKDEIEIIKYAALLHDIGKIGIRDEVLLKQGIFTPEERDEMKTHPLRTRNILENFHFPKSLRRVPFIASQHHEKVNGKGYPSGLTGDELTLGSKILAVTDVFDALTSRRDYPKYFKNETMNYDPMPLSKVIEILKGDSGSHFDPYVVETFLKCIPRALYIYRGSHFSSDYVDETISKLSSQNPCFPLDSCIGTEKAVS